MARKRPTNHQPSIDFDVEPDEPAPAPAPTPFVDRVKRPPPASSHVARVNASRSLFDEPPAPAEAFNGTVIGPPDLSSGELRYMRVDFAFAQI